MRDIEIYTHETVRKQITGRVPWALARPKLNIPSVGLERWAVYYMLSSSEAETRMPRS
jgi:hypothetical protein